MALANTFLWGGAVAANQLKADGMKVEKGLV